MGAPSGDTGIFLFLKYFYKILDKCVLLIIHYLQFQS